MFFFIIFISGYLDLQFLLRNKNLISAITDQVLMHLKYLMKYFLTIETL